MSQTAWLRKIVDNDHDDDRLFKAAYEALPQGVILVDENGRIRYVNPAYKRLFGTTDGEVIGRKFHHTAYDDLLLRAIKQRRKFDGYLKGLQPNKRLKVSAHPLFDDEDFLGTVGYYEEDQKYEQGVQQIPSAVHELENPFPEMIGEHPRLLRELNKAHKAATLDVSMLIMGESGTGKEVLARAIHRASHRSSGPFVALNCGAIPENLMESTLFGHLKGAFTGAHQDQRGKFEAAHRGTLFLDEIGELPLHLQVKLLRVLQDKVYTPVGGHEERTADVKIIAATNKRLQAAVEEGNFREDLFYRLNIIPVELPPLRERREDLALLIPHFTRKITGEMGIDSGYQFEELAYRVLQAYDWPGNVRELENLLRRMVILSNGTTLTLHDIPPSITKEYEAYPQYHMTSGLINLTSSGDLASFATYERAIFKKAYELHGSFNAAGKALGVTHSTVANKIRKFHEKM